MATILISTAMVITLITTLPGVIGTSITVLITEITGVVTMPGAPAITADLAVPGATITIQGLRETALTIQEPEGIRTIQVCRRAAKLPGLAITARLLPLLLQAVVYTPGLQAAIPPRVLPQEAPIPGLVHPAPPIPLVEVSRVLTHAEDNYYFG
jgi:hypothetical protein